MASGTQLSWKSGAKGKGGGAKGLVTCQRGSRDDAHVAALSTSFPIKTFERDFFSIVSKVSCLVRQVSRSLEGFGGILDRSRDPSGILRDFWLFPSHQKPNFRLLYGDIWSSEGGLDRILEFFQGIFGGGGGGTDPQGSFKTGND